MKKDFSDPFEMLNDTQRQDLDSITELDTERRNSAYEEISLDEDSEEVIIEEEPLEEDTEEVDSSGQNDSDIEEEEFDIKIEGNPIYLIATKWKSEGKLPEDFEISEDITEDQFDKAFYAYKETSAMSDIKLRAMDELMEEEGLTPEAIHTAKLLHFGIQDSEIRDLDMYKSLASVSLDADADNFEQQFQDFGIAYYIDKGFTEEQAQRHVKRDLEEDNAVSIADDYRDHFKARYVAQKTNVETRAEAARIKQATEKAERLNFVKTTLEKGQIDGHTYTKAQMEAARKAMFDRTETIRDANGNTRLVTLEQKKILETKANPEKTLKTRIDFILGIDQKAVIEEASVKAKNSLTKDLKKLVKVTPKNSKAIPSGGPVRDSAKYEFEREL